MACARRGPRRQTPPLLERIPNLRAATLVNLGEADQSITPANAAAIKAALEKSPSQHKVNVYPGADHAFHNQDRTAMFHPQSAEDAWHATLGWLKDMPPSGFRDRRLPPRDAKTDATRVLVATPRPLASVLASLGGLAVFKRRPRRAAPVFDRSNDQ